MSGITRKQAHLLKRQVRKLYGRNYIPVVTPDNTLSIGDVLVKKRNILAVLDTSVFNPKNVEFVEGKPMNANITSSSDISLSTKLEGDASFSEHFTVDEAGLEVKFDSKNQMLLKVLGLRQQSIKNFVDFRKELLSKYSTGELPAKVYVVRGLVYADKYYLQYSGSKGGAIGFNLKAGISTANAEVDADFSFKWNRDVGFNINGSKGGVLAYRVSAVRLKRHLIPKNIHENILKGMSESDTLDMVSFKERKKLIEEDALEIVDMTDEVLVFDEDEMV